MAAKAQKGLGRGLSALIAEAADAPAVGAAERQAASNKMPANDSVPAAKLPLRSLRAGAFQPRSYFNEEELSELAESIRKNGVVQPVIVRGIGVAGQYEIIAGERRWRAAGQAGLTEIPAIIMELSDKQALEIALVENIQRQNLTPLEVAEGYQRLIDEFAYTQDQLAEVIGKSRAQISNFLRLLSLPEQIKSLLNKEKISVGHARALLAAPDPVSVADKVVSRGLNVRQTEKLIQNIERPFQQNMAKKKVAISSAVEALRKDEGAEIHRALVAQFSALFSEICQREQDPDIMELQGALSKNLGMTLQIVDEGEKGKIVISYHTLEELDKILRKLERVASLG